jgi:hypothetical protein
MIREERALQLAGKLERLEKMTPGAKVPRSFYCVDGMTEVMPCYKNRAKFDFSASSSALVFFVHNAKQAILCLTLLATALFAAPVLAQPDTTYVLQQSSLSYHMSHPMHEVDGISHAARGKGICHAGECDFLIAAPVKSFDSGDTNRDLHMLEATKGAEFPMIQVRTHFAESEAASSTIYADLDVQFGGQKAHYAHVPFQRTQAGSVVRIVGTVPALCSDFKIDRPSFLTVPIKNEIPVRVDMTWQQQ